jgi:hypothetical protein
VPASDNSTGSGSGTYPSGITAFGDPATTAIALGSGLKLDTTRTCREITAYLAQYVQ